MRSKFFHWKRKRVLQSTCLQAQYLCNISGLVPSDSFPYANVPRPTMECGLKVPARLLSASGDVDLGHKNWESRKQLFAEFVVPVAHGAAWCRISSGWQLPCRVYREPIYRRRAAAASVAVAETRTINIARTSAPLVFQPSFLIHECQLPTSQLHNRFKDFRLTPLKRVRRPDSFMKSISFYGWKLKPGSRPPHEDLAGSEHTFLNVIYITFSWLHKT